MRFGGKHLYLIPAIGLGRARFDDDYCREHAQCTPAEAGELVSDGPALAYDIGVHASKVIAGLAFNITGLAGSTKRTLTALSFRSSSGGSNDKAAAGGRGANEPVRCYNSVRSVQ